MSRVGRRFTERSDRHDDAQPKVRTFTVALAPPLVDLARAFATASSPCNWIQ